MSTDRPRRPGARPSGPKAGASRASAPKPGVSRGSRPKAGAPKPNGRSEPGRLSRGTTGAPRGDAQPTGSSRPRAARPEPAPQRPASPPSPREFREEIPMGDIVYGRHPALAALEGERAVNKVWVLRDLQNQALVANVRQLAKLKGAAVQMVERPKLDALTSGANHQGVVVSIAQADYVELDELITRARASEHPALLMLDGVEDPQNLGALIRTAEGAAFAGVIIPNRRAVGITPVVAKVSAGAVDRVPVARTGNLSQAAEILKKNGFWLVGADASGEALPYDVDLTQPIVVVIGAEGRGLSRLLAEHCDHRVKLPLAGELESLNAAAAGAVLMYEAVRQRLMGQPKA